MVRRNRNRARQDQQQPYDNLLKSLLEGQEKQMLPYFLEGAEYLATLNVEVIRNPLRVDRVYLILYEDEEQILHIEFESNSNPTMASRLLDYHGYLHHKYQKPVISIIVYPFETKMAESPLREKCRGRDRLIFYFDVLPLWLLKAKDYLRKHAVRMYALLPTMQGANAELLLDAIDEMVKYYREDVTKLGCELLWMGILLQRAKIVPLKDKRQVQARLDMYDDLFENDPKIKKIRAASEARGEMKRARKAVVTVVKGRFPALAELARKRTPHINKLNALDNLLLEIGRAPNEEAARALLEATEQKKSGSKQS